MAEPAQQQSNRPPGDDFHQQKLKAWQPILTPWHVVALFFAIAASFIPTGVFLLDTSGNVSFLNTVINRREESNSSPFRFMNRLLSMMGMEQVLARTVVLPPRIRAETAR
jgi:hypothetical protein